MWSRLLEHLNLTNQLLIISNTCAVTTLRQNVCSEKTFGKKPESLNENLQPYLHSIVLNSSKI